MRYLFPAIVALFIGACGSTTTTSGDASVGDAASSSDGASIACGSATCGSKEWCIHPCCGGALPQCSPATDAGTCPPNTQLGPCSGGTGGGGQGCAPPPCAPPPPFCAPKPNSCPNGQGQGPVDNGNVSCVCA